LSDKPVSTISEQRRENTCLLHKDLTSCVMAVIDGLQGFRARCLKPVSLRPEPLSPAAAARVNAWRAFFTTPAATGTPPGARAGALTVAMPKTVAADCGCPAGCAGRVNRH
jgi:hypothetical protein